LKIFDEELERDRLEGDRGIGCSEEAAICLKIGASFYSEILELFLVLFEEVGLEI